MKTIGREPSSDLVVDQQTVSRLHARVELDDDGRVLVEDAGSENGTFLNRNGSWIRVMKVVLCIGDRVRFGDCEVPLQHITAVFGRRSRARLEARHFPPRRSQVPVGLRAGMKDPARDMHKPRRNPATGKIEDERPE